MRRFYQFFTLMMVALLSAAGLQAASRVYYNNPNGWTNVKAYIYKGSSENTTWANAPAMTKAGNHCYIDIPAAFEGGNIIFHNGDGAQYPAATGLKLSDKSMVCCQDKDDDTKTLWVEYQSEAFTVFFDNTTSNWTNPKIHYWGVYPAGTNGTEWPGVALTNPTDKTYSYELPAGTAGVIFTDGTTSGEKTPNLVPTPNAKFNKNGAEGTQIVGDPFYVYWDNTAAKWGTVKVHYFGGAEESEWPGEKMTLAPGETKVYRYQVPAGTSGLVFSDGNGSQTDDLDAVADNLYNQSGNQGVYTPGQGAPDPSAPAKVYILGTVGETNWATTPGIELTKSGNVYAKEGVVIKPTSAGAEFGFITLVTTVGADWDAVNGGNRFGPAVADSQLTSGTAADVTTFVANENASSATSWKVAPGTYDISFDFSTMKFTATLTGSGPVAGNGVLSIPDVSIQPGRDATMEIRIETTKEMTALQLDITLPNVVTAGNPLISRTMGDHQLTSRVLANGDIRVIVYSETNKTFSATNGALLYLPMTAKADAEPNAEGYPITLKNIVFSDKDLLKVTPENVTGKIIVSAITAENIKLDKSVVSLKVGETATVTATVEPVSATVAWTTSNDQVATVDNGVITATGNGSAVITATVGSLTANCTVYVGKNAQHIVWDQTFGTIAVGESSATLAASSYDSNDQKINDINVTFSIVNGSAYAEIVDGKIVGKAVGVVTVQASAAGNDTYAPAEPVTKTVTIWLGYIEGDVTGEGEITVQDATTAVQHILEAALLEEGTKAFKAADMDGDGKIDIVDVTLIINAIGAQPANDPSAPQQQTLAAADKEQFSITRSDYSLRVSFTNMSSYVATQFDILLPDGVEVTSASARGSGHTVSVFPKDNNITRIVVHSKTNANFASDGYIDLGISSNNEGRFVLGNALLNRIEGTSVVEENALGTILDVCGVDSISLGSAEGECSVYTLDGVCIYRGSAEGFNRQANNGVYVISNGAKAQKVVIR